MSVSPVTPEDILAPLRAIVPEPLEVHADTRVIDIDIDSLTLVEWLYALEEQYDMTLDESELEALDRVTIADVCDRITEHLAAAVRAESAG